MISFNASILIDLSTQTVLLFMPHNLSSMSFLSGLVIFQ